jgi:formate hydrogenlyase subunit 3/multisubunit Na+/H+ antiporter MnhD subunit
VALGIVGFVGALFHTLNHALFKSLLFLNSGSMLAATGTQDMNRLGGLMRFMPLTAITALVAAFSISGVPLFNGFASKWTLYTAAIQGSLAAKFLAPCAIVAILTSALTLASFIKFFGASFLSRTSELVRDRAAAKPLEVGGAMQLPQVFLAAACLVLGVAPAIAFGLIGLVLEASQQGLGVILAAGAPLGAGGAVAPALLPGGAVLNPLVLAGLLGVLFLLAWGLARGARAGRRRAEPWLCGYVRESDQVRYRAHSFYADLKRYFRWLGGADPASESRRHLRMDSETQAKPE